MFIYIYICSIYCCFGIVDIPSHVVGSAVHPVNGTWTWLYYGWSWPVHFYWESNASINCKLWLKWPKLAQLFVLQPLFLELLSECPSSVQTLWGGGKQLGPTRNILEQYLIQGIASWQHWHSEKKHVWPCWNNRCFCGNMRQPIPYSMYLSFGNLSLWSNYRHRRPHIVNAPKLNVCVWEIVWIKYFKVSDVLEGGNPRGLMLHHASNRPAWSSTSSFADHCRVSILWVCDLRHFVSQLFCTVKRLCKFILCSFDGFFGTGTCCFLWRGDTVWHRCACKELGTPGRANFHNTIFEAFARAQKVVWCCTPKKCLVQWPNLVPESISADCFPSYFGSMLNIINCGAVYLANSAHAPACRWMRVNRLLRLLRTMSQKLDHDVQALHSLVSATSGVPVRFWAEPIICGVEISWSNAITSLYYR